MQPAPPLEGEGTRRWTPLVAAALALLLGRWIEVAEDRPDETPMATVFLGLLVMAHATLLPRVVGRRSDQASRHRPARLSDRTGSGIPVGVGLGIGMRLLRAFGRSRDDVHPERAGAAHGRVE